MYQEHVKLLKAHGLASPKGLADLCVFALLSIRQPFRSVPKAMQDVGRKGENSRFLWGWKLDGYRAAYGDEGKALYNELKAIDSPELAIGAVYKAIPGLGIAKGAFVAAMLGHDCGCLDSRNAGKHRIDMRYFRADLSHPRILEYVVLCDTLGGAEVLWNEWCCDYAKSSGNFWSGEGASICRRTRGLPLC